jgi:hypothetical protein
LERAVLYVEVGSHLLLVGYWNGLSCMERWVPICCLWVSERSLQYRNYIALDVRMADELEKIWKEEILD